MNVWTSRQQALRPALTWILVTLAIALALPLWTAPTLAQEEREPPPYELKVAEEVVQRAGIGTFCWIWGCVRKIGILTSARPHAFTGELDAALALDYREAPSGLSATLYPVDPATDMTDLEDGMVAWRPSRPGTALALRTALEQPLGLNAEPGRYLLAIAAAWSGESARDAIYGFYLQVEPDALPSPSPSPAASSTQVAATAEPSATAEPTATASPAATEDPVERRHVYLPLLQRR